MCSQLFFFFQIPNSIKWLFNSSRKIWFTEHSNFFLIVFRLKSTRFWNSNFILITRWLFFPPLCSVTTYFPEHSDFILKLFFHHNLTLFTSKHSYALLLFKKKKNFTTQISSLPTPLADNYRTEFPTGYLLRKQGIRLQSCAIAWGTWKRVAWRNAGWKMGVVGIIPPTRSKRRAALYCTVWSTGRHLTSWAQALSARKAFTGWKICDLMGQSVGSVMNYEWFMTRFCCQTDEINNYERSGAGLDCETRRTG